jgi:hypothetical protein
MTFLHQQIQSFLNLGICKEYSIMAKPKNPKKNQEAKEKDNVVSAMPASAPEASAMAPDAPGAAAVAAPEVTELKKPAIRKTANRPEIVKTESRSNLVPINIENEIRQLAYLFSERRGFTPGHETEDWLAAEHEVMQRYHQHSA